MFRLELLEPRELLSAGGKPAYQAAEVSPLARAHLDIIKGFSKQSPSLITPMASPTPVTPPSPVTPVVPPPHRRKTITGSLSGQGSVTPITNSKGTAFFDSSGTTTVLGSATFYGFVPYFANKRHAVRYARGVGVLQDLSGDKIVVSFSGYDRDTGAPDFTFSVKGSVRGGTGNYAGAEGPFTGTGSLNSATGAFSIQLTVKLAPT
ncbi:MAG: hypothetical protein ACXWPK_04705 [Isosphaeraceae bacterium]